MVTDDETVGQRCYLVWVTDTGHRTTLGDDIFKVIQQVKDLFLFHRVAVTLLDPGDFPGHAHMHILWRTLVKVAIPVLEGILVDPYAACEIISLKIIRSCFYSLFIGIDPGLLFPGLYRCVLLRFRFHITDNILCAPLVQIND